MSMAHEQSAPKRGFWSLIVTQFEGAFNDNALKTIVLFAGLNMRLSPRLHDSVWPLTAGLFSLPFILFSMVGGYFADKYSKRTVTVAVKCLEIGIMVFATLGFLLVNLWMGLAAIFLMGVHSAIFGPSKYGLLPELLTEKELSWGNGVLELGTFLAIITGIAAGGILYGQFAHQQVWCGLLLVAFAVAGLAVSIGITRVPAAAPTRKFNGNFVAELWRQCQEMRKDRVLWLACLGNTYFWFIGQLFQQSVVDYSQNVLHVKAESTSLLLAVLAIGIGLGSFAAGYLSGGKIEYGLVPLGSIGLFVFAALLGAFKFSFTQTLVVTAALGFFGGFFIVPISALLQHRPKREGRGEVLAAANLLSSVGLVLAAAVYWVL